MLRELSVQNLALIEDARVELQPGFCAWTGETGAGKSLLLGALNLLLGERGSSDWIRAGCEESRVTGRFEIGNAELQTQIEQLLDRPLDEGSLILSRRLNRNGRSYAYVDEQPVSVSTLKQLGGLLVDIHGQRETESLLEPGYQLQLLDAFGGHLNVRKKYQILAEKVRALRARYRQLDEQRQQRQRELALIHFEKDELDQARLVPGETEELTRERDRLMHAQNLQSFAARGYAELYEDEQSVTDLLGKLEREAQNWVKLDERLEEVVRRLDGLQGEARDLAQTLRRLGERWEADPERLEEVEKRLQLLRRLETKHRKSVDDLIVYRLALDEDERRLQQQEDDLTQVTAELQSAHQKWKESASELSRKRHAVAGKLARQTQEELADLGMGEAKLEIHIEAIDLGNDPLEGDVPDSGADVMELTLAANPGEAALPLRKVASGGELSRTMLALKTVLATHDRRATLVFDEIDANVGGRLGDVLGQKLASLGRTHQVICVTHLPQVAAYARHHWSIRKQRQGRRTVTQIEALEPAGRLDELASMLRGEARTETTTREVSAMLDEARQWW
jgi:DNA repair protein RecN (Recombination protein N)